MKLSTKIIIALLIVIAVPVMFFAVLFFAQARTSIIQGELSKLDALAESKYDAVVEQFGHLEEAMEIFALRFVFRDGLRAVEQGQVVPDVMLQALQEMAVIDHHWEEMYVVDREGLVVQSTVNGRFEEIVRDAVVQLPAQHVALTHFLYNDEVRFVVVAPVFEAERVLGYLAGITEPKIFDFLSTDYTSLGRTGDIVIGILTHDGEIRFLGPRRFEDDQSARDRIMLFEDLAIARAVRGENRVFDVTRDYRDEPVFAATRALPQYGVGISIEQDRSEVLEAFDQLRLYTLGVIIAMVFLLVLVSLYMSRIISQPLSRLAAVAARVAQGEFEAKDELRTSIKGDELSVLETSFRLMVNQLEQTQHSMQARVDEATSGLQQQLDRIKEQELEATRTKQAVINILEDLEEEKNHAQEAADDALKFKQATENSTEAIVITDPDGHILYVNPAYERLNGYSAAEVVGKTPGVIRSEKTPTSLYKDMWENYLLKGKPYVTEDLVNKRKDGSEYNARLSIYPVEEGGRVQYFVGVQQDITERKLVERAKTDFISVASHQLRTPLSAMSWFVEALNDEDLGPLNAEQKDYMQQLSVSTKRLVKLVNDLLNISRIESGRWKIEPQPTNIVELIDDVLAGMNLFFEAKNCMVTFDRPKGKVRMIDLDRGLMEQVIQNLLSNAIKYSDKICDVRIGITEREDAYVVSVADQGIGIAPEFHSSVFGKFKRSEEASAMDTEGSGLGLYIVKLIVEALGGDIWFETRVHKGTTFYVTIPFKGVSAKEGEVRLT